MRHRSPVWIALARYGRFHFETKARIGTTEYTAISAPRVDRAVMGTPLTVGGCTSATLNLSILTDDSIAASTPIVILGRLTDGVNNSEWLEFGTFYINQRDTSYEGLITVSCYDAMLKANQTYLDGNDNSANWPKTMKSVVEEIAYRIGVSIDPRTQINVGDDYIVPEPIDLTMMQVLGYIGACHGGNWIITEDNALRLVPLASAPVTYAHTSEHPESVIPQTYYITDENDLSIETPEGHALVWAVDGSADPADGLTTVTAVLGQLTNGTAVTVTGIVVSDNKGNSYTAGNKAGGVITIDGNPYVNQNICDALYEKYNGLVYEPYTASKTVYDPATELGDQIIIGDKVHSVLCTAKMVMDLGFRSDISAPNSEALSEEYPYLSEIKKLRQTAAELNEAINAKAEELTEKINNASGDTTALSNALTEEVKRASGVEKELDTRIGDEETRAKAAEKGLSDRVKALEDTNPSQVTADLSALKQGVQKNAEDIKTNSEALSALDTTVKQHATDITAIKEKDTSQDEAIKALQDAQAAQAETLTAVQETNTAQGEAIKALQEKDTAIDTEISGIKGEITTLKEKDTALDGVIATMQESITAHGQNLETLSKASASHDTDLTGLKERMTNAETVLGEYEQILTTLQEIVSSMQQSITSILSRLDALEQSNSGSEGGGTE